MHESTSLQDPISLRARKKAETWTALHDTAAGLALEHGLEGATVERIAAGAGVSTRTFFNYFSCKEDAVLGVRAPELDPSLLDSFTLDQDVVGRVSRLLLAVARSAYGGDVARRTVLVERFAGLAERRRRLMVDAEDLVRRAVADRLRERPAWAASTAGDDVDEVARMLVMLAGLPLRHALSAPDRPPGMLSAAEHATSLDLLRRLQESLS